MSFESTRSKFNQTHFTVVEFDLPVVDAGFGTPLSASGAASTGNKTYKFTDYAGILPESGIKKCLISITESATKLMPGKGVPLKASGSLVFADFQGDPNPFAPDVTEQVKNQGTFFGKLNARNILTNKPIRIKNYRLNDDGTADLLAAETRSYIIDSIDSSGQLKWTVKIKDELSRINIDEAVWPLTSNGFLRTDLSESGTTLLVDSNVDYAIGDLIRIGEELLKISNVSGIGTSTAQLLVSTRGRDIVYTNGISKTIKEEHSAGDEIILCDVSDNENVADLIKRILVGVGVDSSLIPISDWLEETNTWLNGVFVNSAFVENEQVSVVLENILTSYSLDMWYDPVARQVKLSAINAWKESSIELFEGNHIDFETIKVAKNEQLRSTRAFVVYDKRFLASTDSIENYKKGSIFIRPELENEDFFGEPKVKQLGYNFLIDKPAADLMVNRWVNRYISPSNYSWKTQERKLIFNVGDIVDINSESEVDFDGLPSTKTRAQVLSIQPKYTKYGREYMVSALAYEPVLSDNSEIVISGALNNINLYTQYAGAPSTAVNITFIFDNVRLAGSSSIIPAMKAGNFPNGSKLTIILINGSELMGKGGDGGKGADGAGFSTSPPTTIPGKGVNGGVVYDAEGVDTDIYFSGSTTSAAYPNANGYIIAPSGGDGGFTWFQVAPQAYLGGSGGNGGDGDFIGQGGAVGDVGNQPVQQPGDAGTNDRLTGNFGVNGVANDSDFGLAGKGVVDSGATVNFFGADSARYINGRGDH